MLDEPISEGAGTVGVAPLGGAGGSAGGTGCEGAGLAGAAGCVGACGAVGSTLSLAAGEGRPVDLYPQSWTGQIAARRLRKL